MLRLKCNKIIFRVEIKQVKQKILHSIYENIFKKHPIMSSKVYSFVIFKAIFKSKLTTFRHISEGTCNRKGIKFVGTVVKKKTYLFQYKLSYRNETGNNHHGLVSTSV